MKIFGRIYDAFYAFIAYVAIGYLWQILEMVFYGEIQTRMVDNIVTIAWIAFVVWMYNRGLRQGIAEAEELYQLGLIHNTSKG